MTRRRRVDLRADDIAYLGGLLDAFADLSDGAFESCCVDSIRQCGEFKGRDPHDVWLAWCFANRAKPI
jgi:hypothetical protein